MREAWFGVHIKSPDGKIWQGVSNSLLPQQRFYGDLEEPQIPLQLVHTGQTIAIRPAWQDALSSITIEEVDDGKDRITPLIWGPSESQAQFKEIPFKDKTIAIRCVGPNPADTSQTIEIVVYLNP